MESTDAGPETGTYPLGNHGVLLILLTSPYIKSLKWNNAMRGRIHRLEAITKNENFRPFCINLYSKISIHFACTCVFGMQLKITCVASKNKSRQATHSRTFKGSNDMQIRILKN